jgi:hypothetical protein
MLSGELLSPSALLRLTFCSQSPSELAQAKSNELRPLYECWVRDVLGKFAIRFLVFLLPVAVSSSSNVFNPTPICSTPLCRIGRCWLRDACGKR